MSTEQQRARAVLREAGRTLAEEARIRLAHKPAPLWQLLILVNLLSTRIAADIAIAAARELNAAGGTTPHGMAELTWQDRVDALGRGHYVRYDESTATRLGECAALVADEYRGDLRRLAAAAEHDRGRLETLLQRFPGIGPTGAHMFCREAQDVWPWLRPYTDTLARRGAEAVELPTDEQALGRLVEGRDMARLTAGLTRVARDSGLAGKVRTAVG